MTNEPRELPPAAAVAEPFLAGTLAALQELCRCEGYVLPDGAAHASSSEPAIVAQVKLLRSRPGRLVVRLPLSVARQLAARYLPADAELTDELLNDVAGELANVIAGQGKTGLKGTAFHFLLSTPETSRLGAPLPLDAAEGEYVIGCEAGVLTLWLRLPADPTAADLSLEVCRRQARP